MPSAPNKKSAHFSFDVEVSDFVKKLMIQKAMAAKTHRTVTPDNGLIQNGKRYFKAFIFKPLKVLDTIMLMFAFVFSLSTIVYFIGCFKNV